MYEINDRVSVTPRNIMDQLAALSVALIGDALGRYGCMEHTIKPLCEKFRIAGPAITVQTYRADNLMIHKALEMAEENDIIVVDGGGICDTGLWGALMSRMAVKKKIGGIVLDGGARDRLEIIEMGFPVFCKAVSPMGGFKASPGSINTKISCGRVSVSPGDVIIGDADGVVVVPHQIAAQVAEKAQQVLKNEENIIEGMENGESLYNLLKLDKVFEKLQIPQKRSS